MAADWGCFRLSCGGSGPGFDADLFTASGPTRANWATVAVSIDLARVERAQFLDSREAAAAAVQATASRTRALL